jgi:uncharacterized glyoxalase superfamily protein PhnB
MFRRGAPYFPVADVVVSGSYYRDVYGFTHEYSGGTEFAICSRDGCAVMFRRVTDASQIRPMESQGGTWDAFFWVADAQALFDELQARGAIVAYPITVQPYGMKEFAVRDPDGHVLGFGEALGDPPTHFAE